MIIATAGHVDHGKTSLVRALTQVDTDRLAEEKRRGMSIDLGFAYADFGLEEPLGFVDVPGHERFVRNMLAGVAAIDCALLVVAADDGPMPQTLEHLAILEILGVSCALVALTKIDRVDDLRRAEVQREIHELLSTTAMRGSPIFPVVATTGQGVFSLREALKGVAQEHEAHRLLDQDAEPENVPGHFRLSVDRAFTLTGAGLVVSGSVYSGVAQVGDRVLVSPKGVEARIRAIHAQNQAAKYARVGQRCALNLSGVDLKKEDVARGDWVLVPAIHAPTQRLDVELNLLVTESRSLADGAIVQLHLAAASVPARVSLLRQKALKPGEVSLAQLVLDKPVGALRGDRFVLRDQAAQRTLGGGRVLDPFGPLKGRAKPARLVELAAMSAPTATVCLAQLLVEKTDAVELQPFERAWNLNEYEQASLRALPDLHVVRALDGDLALSKVQWQGWRDQLVQTLTDYHLAQAESIGLSESALIAQALKVRSVQSRTLKVIVRSALRSLLDEEKIVREGLSVRMPVHQARLSQKDQILLEKVTIVLLAGGLRPPIVGELAKALDADPAALLSFLQRVSLTGHLSAVASNRFYLPRTLAELVQVARDLAALSPDQGFDAAAFRDRSGIGRNSTIEVLEFMDRHGYTRFARKRRWMLDDGPSP